MQYNLLWESTSHPSKAKDTSTPSTSQDCGKCYNVDLNVYSTNLANMEAMRKEIIRLNAMLNKSGKDDQSKRPKYKDGRLPHIKNGLGHEKGNKTNGRKVINGFECVQFISKGKIGTDRPAQSVTQKPTRAAQPVKRSSAAVKGGSATPPRKGKITYFSFAHDKPKKQVYKVKNEPQKPKNTIWATPNRYSYQPKAHAHRQSLSSCFVLKNNSKGEVYAKYVGKDRNVYINTSIWVPKILVTNMQGPKNIWGPKSRN
jgi:hypothetical protein